ncbi:MAG TPA: copper chaperone PCu(A)C [Gammaproteobacteria bacterium]|nr:copper chaperone PCu(A)C [Gammaproteobacteria bacterium]
MKRLLSILCLALFASGAWAGGVTVSNPWIRYLPGGAPSAGYFTLHNGTDHKVRLTGAHCDAFGRTMLHRSVEKDGVSRMIHVDGVDAAPGKDIRFQPGGYHVMFMMPKHALKIGSRMPVTLHFADRPDMKVEFTVRPPSAQ